METRLIVHPRYAHLEEFLRTIPARGYRPGEVFRERRNRVEQIEAEEGTRLVVKRFRIHNWYQHIHFSLFGSKARHSYKNSLRMLGLGIATAPPVACLEVWDKGILLEDYFISEYLPYETMQRIEEQPDELRVAIIRDFARHTAEMHAKRVRHRDYNLSNIFFRPGDGRYEFILIDVNRARFGRMTMPRVLAELSRLQHISLPTMVTILEQYATVRGLNPELFVARLLFERTMGPRACVKWIQHGVKRRFRRK